MFPKDRINVFWRAAPLGILLVAIMGPWAYDVVHVPAEYSCSAPFVRLEGDFCGTTLSGLRIIIFMAIILISPLLSLFTGALQGADILRESLFSLSGLILLLPFLITLLLIKNEGSRNWKIVLAAAWSLAAGAGLLIGMSSRATSIWALWGNWLYIAVALSALIVEGLGLVFERRLRLGR